MSAGCAREPHRQCSAAGNGTQARHHSGLTKAALRTPGNISGTRFTETVCELRKAIRSSGSHCHRDPAGERACERLSCRCQQTGDKLSSSDVRRYDRALIGPCVRLVIDNRRNAPLIFFSRVDHLHLGSYLFKSCFVRSIENAFKY